MNSAIATDILERAEAALESIRPYLNADGGDIRVIDFRGDVLRIKLLGNCSDCKMSEMTMKAGVEEAILRAVPEIKKVEAI